MPLLSVGDVYATSLREETPREAVLSVYNTTRALEIGSSCSYSRAVGGTIARPPRNSLIRGQMDITAWPESLRAPSSDSYVDIVM